MSLTSAKAPSLKDKLADQEKSLVKEVDVVESELEAVKKAKKRASKDD